MPHHAVDGSSYLLRQPVAFLDQGFHDIGLECLEDKSYRRCDMPARHVLSVNAPEGEAPTLSMY